MDLVRIRKEREAARIFTEFVKDQRKSLRGEQENKLWIRAYPAKMVDAIEGTEKD